MSIRTWSTEFDPNMAVKKDNTSTIYSSKKAILTGKQAGFSLMERNFIRQEVGGGATPDRRVSVRMSLTAPAKLVCVYDTFDCVLLDLSGFGALVASASPLSVGTSAYLRAGTSEIFAVGVRKVSCPGAPFLIGVMFDERLTRDQIISLRTYARDWIRIEQRREYCAARDWWNAGILSWPRGRNDPRTWPRIPCA
jgi:hypothetical protein